MIPIKSPSDIAIMQTGGQILHRIKNQLVDSIQAGVTPLEIDQHAEKLILDFGAQASFKTVSGYQHPTCININSGVVHGIPNHRPFISGDIVTLDIGLLYQGFHTDTSTTIPVGIPTPEIRNFLDSGRQALTAAIQAAQPGNHVGHISRSIEFTIKQAGYSPVLDLTGHGIGRELHEPPNIPCYLKTTVNKTPFLKSGMVLAIEVIYTQGSPALVMQNDGWTISTRDGKISAVFEDTIALTPGGPQILT